MKQTPAKSPFKGKKGNKANNLSIEHVPDNEDNGLAKQNRRGSLHAVKQGNISKPKNTKSPNKNKTPIKKSKAEVVQESDGESGNEVALDVTVTAKNRTPRKKNKGVLQTPNKTAMDVSKSAKKKSPAKKRTENVESEDSNKEEEKKIKTPIRTLNKKGKSIKKVIERESDEDTEEEEEENIDSHGNNENIGLFDNGNTEDSDDDEDDDDNDDYKDIDNDSMASEEQDGDSEEDEKGQEGLEEQDESDEGAEEDHKDLNGEATKKISKKSPPTKFEKGLIPPNYPLNKVVHVNNLPKDCKEVDVLEVFAAFGPIYMIHLTNGPSVNVANVAFRTAKAAQAAVASSSKIELQGKKLRVAPKTESVKKLQSKEELRELQKRGVCIKKMSESTTEEDLKEHFSSCGEIDSIKFFGMPNPMAFVNFKSEESVPKALLLDKSILKDHNITVNRCVPSTQQQQKMEEQNNKTTIVVHNTEKLRSIEVSKLHAIFDSCGEITKLKLICGSNILAFITFKDEDAVENAFKLDGTEQQGMQIKLEHCSPPPNKTATFVANLDRDVTVEDLKQLFSQCGEIKHVALKEGTAIIYFKDSDAFCKSFLLNEYRLRQRNIYLRPYSKSEKFKRPFPQTAQKSFHNNNKRFKMAK